MKYKTNISYRTRKYYNMLKKELMKISKTRILNLVYQNRELILVCL